jgi:hypothetical protein
MSKKDQETQKQLLDPLLKNQLIGGICAALVVIFACIRIFVLHASVDGMFMNLMSIANAVLSLVVLTSAVRIMLYSKRKQDFDDVLATKLKAIDDRYGALIEASDDYLGDDACGTTFSIANNVDAVFVTDTNDWSELEYMEKFSFSPSFKQTKKIYFYVNYCNMEARALKRRESQEVTGKILARDTAVAVQRAFSDILTVHALDIAHEENRAVVTISISRAETSQDASRIADLLDYLLFLHFVEA